MPHTPQQSQASNPATSSWVAASAGTGKTKVLTDRVLRLLLQGTAPDKILCITYTRAAAAEMLSRIQGTLQSWALLSQSELRRTISELLETEAGDTNLKRASQLYLTVLDASPGLRIQTIHAFCQSILQRFPAEAGLPPHTALMEDERLRQSLIATAQSRLFSQTKGNAANTTLLNALQLLSNNLHESSFATLMQQLMQQRIRLLTLWEREGGSQPLFARLSHALGVEPDESEAALIANFISSPRQDEASLRQLAALWQTHSKFQDRGDALADYLAHPVERSSKIDTYALFFCTQKYEPAAERTLLPKTHFQTDTFYQAAWPVIQAEQQRITQFLEKRKALHIKDATQALLTIAEALFKEYEQLKRQHALMDYDDVIALTLKLFDSAGAGWVLYKLDQGLEHLLVDEAQDTSPALWQLVACLAEEFFAGDAQHDAPRTLFVVGDEKQSIYGFQGADPGAFHAARHYFATQAQGSGQGWVDVPLETSFRSSAPVLKLVDTVFNNEDMLQALGVDTPVHHALFHAGRAGHVELWPKLARPNFEKEELAEIWTEYPDYAGDAAVTADYVASVIEGWLQQGRRLASQNRPVRPDDILILLRKRGALASALSRALKKRSIAVAGSDRLKLMEHIAVMDVLALGEWLCLPEDDLLLAGLLKSPIFNMTEEMLFDLAHNRGEQSLWYALQEKAEQHAAWSACEQRLMHWQQRATQVTPFTLFSELLDNQGGRKAFVARLGEEVHDPLDALLNLAQSYEQAHPPSMQQFIDWMHAVDTELKRDMEQSAGQVRIMTVHGAKGLQAPIVILPDATGGLRHNVDILWDEAYEGGPVMFWAPSKPADTEATRALRDTHKQAEEDEHARLLYVALTRAEEELYIGGCTQAQNTQGKSWYERVETAFGELGELLPAPEINIAYEDEEAASLIFSMPQTVDTKDAITTEASAIIPAPNWLEHPVKQEELTPSPITPSHWGKDDAQPHQSYQTTGADADAAKQRGTMLHTLLQFLPAITAANREEKARRYLLNQGVKEKDHAALIAPILTLLQHPDLQHVFTEGSMAEIPIHGSIEGRAVHGTIDRLVVSEESVLVVDYKTNRHPPTRTEDIPLDYIRQMQAYALLLAEIYPNKTIEAALLWTENSQLMPIPHTMLFKETTRMTA